MLRDSSDPLLLPSVYRLEAIALLRAAPRLHLDKDKAVPLLCDEVDLISVKAIIFRQDKKALGTEIIRGERLVALPLLMIFLLSQYV